MSRCSTQNPQSATVKFFIKGTSQAIPCLYEEIQGKRLILEVSAPVPASTAVTVEYNDALFLGEVITCAEVNSLCKIEVRVEQILTGLQSLIALRARLLGENAVQPSRTAPVETVVYAISDFKTHLPLALPSFSLDDSDRRGENRLAQ